VAARSRAAGIAATLPWRDQRLLAEDFFAVHLLHLAIVVWTTTGGARRGMCNARADNQLGSPKPRISNEACWSCCAVPFPRPAGPLLPRALLYAGFGHWLPDARITRIGHRARSPDRRHWHRYPRPLRTAAGRACLASHCFGSAFDGKSSVPHFNL